MPMKGSGSSEPREIDRFDGGVGWMVYPGERMGRASHALATDAGVYVLDPVDYDGLDDLLAELGEVAGVAVCLDRHKRDSAAVANRHDVPVYVPHWMAGVKSDLDAPVEEFGGQLPGTDYRVLPMIKNFAWKEYALFDGETLHVAEAVGTAPYYVVGDERLGVHPMLRAFPPRSQLGDLEPERILVGHGEGIMEDAKGALSDALGGARRRMPAAYAKAFRGMISG